MTVSYIVASIIFAIVLASIAFVLIGKIEHKNRHGCSTLIEHPVLSKTLNYSFSRIGHLKLPLDSHKPVMRKG